MAMVDLKVPQIGESVSTVFIAGWLKNVGDHVEAGEPVIEVDSDKASMEVPSPVSGVLREQLAEEGDEVDITAILGKIEEGAEGASASEGGESAPADEESAPADAGGDVKAGPAARREAQSSGVDIKDVKGTGRRGNVTSADVKAQVKELESEFSVSGFALLDIY